MHIVKSYAPHIASCDALRIATYNAPFMTGYYTLRILDECITAYCVIVSSLLCAQNLTACIHCVVCTFHI